MLADCGPIALAVLTTLVAPPAMAGPSTSNQPASSKRAGAKSGKKKNSRKKKKKKKNEGVGPFAKNKYPQAQIRRPLVLPHKMGQIELGVLAPQVHRTTNALQVLPGFSYGIEDVVELGASLNFLLLPSPGASPQIELRGHFLVHDSKELDVAPGLRAVLPLNDTVPLVVTAEAPSRYIVDKKLAVAFGRDAATLTHLTAEGGAAPAVDLRAIGGVIYQANRQVSLTADLGVAWARVLPDVIVSGVWELLDLDVGGQYSWDRRWDVSANVGAMVAWTGPSGLTVRALVAGRYRF